MEIINHYISNDDETLFTYPIGNGITFESVKDNILRDIINHLKQNPNDCLEHSKDFTAKEKKKYAGKSIINFYEVNPKSGTPCKIVIRGNKTYYKALEIPQTK